MTEPVRPDDLGRVRAFLGAPLAVVLLLATIGSFAVGFGVMTSCTNTYSCTPTGCPPCRTTSAWLTTGWIGQGLLLLTGAALAVPAARRVHLQAVRLAAALLGPLSVTLIVLTTALAVRSA